jgi:hypothetical protein
MSAPVVKFVPVDDLPLVQLLIITINGTQYALVGPVIHVPGNNPSFNITEIEFGDILPASAAARMLEGAFREHMGSKVQ